MEKATSTLLLAGAMLLAGWFRAEAQQPGSARTGSVHVGTVSTVVEIGGKREALFSFRKAAAFRASGRRGKQVFPGHIRRFRTFPGIGTTDTQIIVIERAVPVPVVEIRESPSRKVYVPPRWVDGGHGVEVLQPGYWAEATQAPR